MTGVILYSLVPAEPTFEIGEPIWLVIRVENRSTETVEGTVETSLVSRTEELFVSVTGPDGKPAHDPWRFLPPCCASNTFSTAEARPGETAELRIDLAKYAWLDAPGPYEVQLLAPFAVTSRDRPSPDDARWVETKVVMEAPSDARGLVLSIPQTRDEASKARRERGLEWSRMDVNTYDALGHVLYVPILEDLAKASAADPDYPWGDDRFRVWDAVDERDLYGLGACPCTEATEALLRLFDHFEHDPENRKVVMEELSRRMPRRPRASSWFVEQAWSEELDDDVLMRARRALDGPTSIPGWSETAAWGADVVRRLGSSSDGALLAKAMEHTLALPDELGPHGTSSSTEVVRSLEWALAEHPATTRGLSDSAALMVELQAWDGRTGSPPPGWEVIVLRGLASPEPEVVATAAEKLPHPASPALMRAILPHLGSAHRGVSASLQRYVVRFPPDADPFLPMLKAELASAEPSRVVGLLNALKEYLPVDAWLDHVLVRILNDRTNQDLVRLPLLALTRCPHSGMGPIAQDEVPRLWAAWQRALATRRSELRHGPLPIIPGETDPALVPASYQCTLASGAVWPSR